MKKFEEKIDEVRAAATRQLMADGYEPILKHSRRCLLKTREKLTDRQTAKPKNLLKCNLCSVRAWLMREVLDQGYRGGGSGSVEILARQKSFGTSAIRFQIL